MANLRSLIGICALAASAALVHAEPIGESDAKAAFIVNFASFTDWPVVAGRDSSTLVVCVGPASPMRRPLESLAGRAVGSRTLQVRVPSSVDDAATCQVLIVDAFERARIPSLIRALGNHPVLTIGDGSNFHLEGLVVAVAVEQSRLRFRVNLQAARRAQLEISAKVLRLAEAVD